MVRKESDAEAAGLRDHLQAEISRLESERQGLSALIIFLACALGFGALSLFLPRGLWRAGPVELIIPPQLIFVVLVVALVASIYIVRREAELRKIRLLTLRQLMRSQMEHSASMFDPVTNVFTRRFLNELLHREIARAERNRRPLGVMMCDVNNFKQVNDRYGHLVGDEVLAQVAAILKSCVRGSDHVVRYGGDEFVLILPETDDQGALIVRGRIQEKVAEWDRAHRLGDVPISVSVGWYLHTPGCSAEQTLSEADARMYADKQASLGR